MCLRQGCHGAAASEAPTSFESISHLWSSRFLVLLPMATSVRNTSYPSLATHEGFLSASGRGKEAKKHEGTRNNGNSNYAASRISQSPTAKKKPRCSSLIRG